MRIITTDDFIETYAKGVQRGIGFLVSKFRFRADERMRSAFDNSAVRASSWWMIPAVRRRWNELISGDPEISYEDHVVRTYLQGRRDLKMLSLGSGTCSHEIRFAGHSCMGTVTCVDLAGNLLEKAGETSREMGLDNISFIRADARRMDLGKGLYDLILFHASLHHFSRIDEWIGSSILGALRNGGILVVNEYVGPNRLQYPSDQIRAVNRALQVIPRQYRQRYRLRIHKSRVSGPGLLRMILADPSEAQESAGIPGILNKHLESLEVKPYGGNLLMPVLKDIAHHFVDEKPETEEILGHLFRLEDEYLKNARSDFMFAVYRKEIKSTDP